MTEVAEEVREGNAAETVAASANAECAQRANSLTQPSSVALDAVTQSARAAFRFTMSGIAAIDRAGSLVDAQPPTFRQARDWHHTCARHYSAGLVRWPRLLWAYLHMLLVAPALRFAEWVTASPARAAVAAVILAVIWIWRP